MAYDGFYSDLSTRGTTNQILSQALGIRDQILISEENVEQLEASASNSAAVASASSSSAATNANLAETAATSALASQSSAAISAATATQAAADAITNSEAALVVANTANATANTANINANNAVTTANGIAGTANTALSNSVTAVNTANTANTNASSALSLATAAQPGDATLTALAALVTSANKMIYSTGVDSFSLADLSAFARTFLDDTSAPAVRTTLGVLNVDIGYIEGIELSFVSSTAFNVTTGSAYVPGLGKVVTLPSNVNITGFTGTASTFYYVYLTEITGTPTIEYSSTAPTIYSGTAYTKTGDSSRRLVGQVLTLGANVIAPFRHLSGEGRMRYYAGNWAVSPYALVIGGTVTTPFTINAAVVVPATATSMHVSIYKATAGTFLAGNADLGTLSVTNYLHSTDDSRGVEVWIELSRNSSPRTFTYLVTSGSVNILAYGYKFDR